MVGPPALAQEGCTDVFALFARGSGQTPYQVDTTESGERRAREAVSFFNALDARLDDEGASFAHLDIENEEGGSANGYVATGGTKNFVPAKYPWTEGMFGDAYRTSREDGTTEVVAFLRQQTSRCPDQQIVVGGYSQGAHVVGEALDQLGDSLADQIAYVALFGDPRFDNATHSITWNDWFGRTHETPYLRGSIKNWKAGGQLGSRHPYTTPSNTYRTGSWCDNEDGICSGALKDVPSGWGTHGSYPDGAVHVAANEAVDALIERLPEKAESIGPKPIPGHASEIDMLDLAVLFDTTGSMSGSIDSAKSQAVDLAEQMAGLFPSTRLSLVEFRDHGDDFVARRLVDLTSDTDEFVAGVQTLEAYGGGDAPEATLSALMTAFDQQWRDGAAKIAVVITDAPMHDPEPVTGYTSEQVLDVAYNLDPVNIYPVLTYDSTAARESAETLADGSDGLVFTISDGDELADTLREVVDTVSLEPIASAGGPYVARPGQPVWLSAGGSVDPDNVLTTFEWDVDGDGTFDITSDSPSTSYTYDAPYDGPLGLRVTSKDGGSSTGMTTITVAAGAAWPVPAAPEDVTATVVDGTSGTVDVSWSQPSGGQQALAFGIRDRDGRLLGVVDPDAREVTLEDVPAGTHLVSVEADGEYGPSQPAASNEFVIGDGDVVRVGGEDRIETAVLVSQRRSGADTVVLARADDYADALTGAPLAHKVDAPLLLTGSTALHDDVADEIRRLGADRALLLGGPAALSDAVASQVAELGLDVSRVQGEDRFATAAAIAGRVGGDAAYLVEGANADPTRGWPDAVAVSALAAQSQRPILLTARDVLPDATVGALEGSDFGSVTVVGGPAAVSDDVVARAGTLSADVGRLWGETRYETSVAVADRAVGEFGAPSHVWLVTGQNWPDSLAVAPTVAASGGVLLLAEPSHLAGTAAGSWLAAHPSVGGVTVVGGPDALSEQVMADAVRLLDD